MFRNRWWQTLPCWIIPLGLPSVLFKLQCGRTLPFHSCRTRLQPPVRRKLSIRRGRAQDGNHGRIPWRQPLAHEPCRLRYGFAVRGRLQSEPGPNPKSKSHLSRPDLCPSYESALKRGGNSSACTRDGCAPFLLALDHARLAIAKRRRRWPSDAEHSEKRVVEKCRLQTTQGNKTREFCP